MLTFALVLTGMGPFTYQSWASTGIEGEEAGTVTTNGSAEKIFAMDQTAPSGYDPESTENPYGYGKDVPFMMYSQNEMAFQVETQIESTSRLSKVKYYEQFNPGDIDDSEMAENLLENDSSYKTGGSLEQDVKAHYVKAIACDPTGSGRKDHIAYIGYQPSTGYVITWLQDAKTGRTGTPKSVRNAAWMGGVGDTGIGQYVATNFMSITAGDFNGDGKDTIVVYAAIGNGRGVLEEYKLINTGNEELEYVGYNTSLLKNSAAVLDGSSKVRNQLGAEIAAGDVNGDGLDDLAVMSYYSWTTAGHGLGHYKYYCPDLKVTYGDANSPNIIKRGAEKSTLVYTVDEDDDQSLHTMIAPGISVGDADNDRCAEIVVSGIYNNVELEDDKTDVYDGHNVDTNYVTVMSYGTDGADNLYKEAYGKVNTNEWADNGIYDNEDDVWQQTAVECVAINGKSNGEMVFINGTLYQIIGSAVSAVFTPDYFKSIDSAAGGSAVTVNYVQSASAGVFDGNTSGREQVAFTLGLKCSGAEKYYFVAGLIGGTGYEGDSEGDEDCFGVASKYYSTDIEREPYLVRAEGTRLYDGTNCNVIAIDNNYDGIVAKYNTKGYVYTNPSVTAVIQAAPFFSELDNSGYTEYSVTESYDFSTSAGYDVSFAAGLSAEVDLGWLFGSKTSLRLGYGMNWSKSFTDSQGTSYTTYFNATSQDTVVVKRTPVVVYQYDIQQLDGTWKENAYDLTIPQGPSYVQLSVDDYNAFVDEYNGRIEKNKLAITKLKQIDKERLHLGNEGNPAGYDSDIYETFGANHALGMAGGTNSSNYSQYSSSTEDESTSHGFDFSYSSMWGAKALGNEGMAGFYLDLSFRRSKGSSTTTGNSSGISGTVYNLQTSDFPDGLVEQYYYEWKLAREHFYYEQGTDEKATVVCYQVKNVIAPPASPVMTYANADGTDITLEWQMPAASLDKTSLFEVAKLEADGSKTVIGTISKDDAKGTGDKFHCTLTNLASGGHNISYSAPPNSTLVFVVSAKDEAGRKSFFSNRLKVRTTGEKVSITANVSGIEGLASLSIDCPESDEHISASPSSGNKTMQVEYGHTLNISASAVGTEENHEGPEYVITAIKVNANDEEYFYNFSSKHASCQIIVEGNTSISVLTEEVLKDSQITYQDTVRAKDPVTGKTTVQGNVYAYISDEEGNKTSPFYSDSNVDVENPLVFEAVPREGYVLTGWKITYGAGEEDCYTIPRDGYDVLRFLPFAAEHNINAVFEKEEDAQRATFTINDAEGGQFLVTDEDGKQILPDDKGQISAIKGRYIFIEAKPLNQYYKFDGWNQSVMEGSYFDDESDMKLEILVGDNIENLVVGGTFHLTVRNEIRYGVKGTGGRLVAESDGKSIESGTIFSPSTNIKFTAIPDEGYRVAGWDYEDLSGHTKSSTDTHKQILDYKVKGNEGVFVKFIPEETYQVNIAQSDKGKVNVYYNGEALKSGDKVPYGAIVIAVATPNEGQKFNRLYCTFDSEEMSFTEETRENNLSEFADGDLWFCADFETISYPVELDKMEHGYITAEADGVALQSGDKVPYGTKVTITPICEEGYALEKLLVNGAFAGRDETGYNYVVTGPSSIKGYFTEIIKEWNYDESMHWTEGDEQSKEPHSFGTVEIIEESTLFQEGIGKRICTVCGYGEEFSLPHLGHFFGEEWQHQGEFHWHQCSCGMMNDFGIHEYGPFEIVKKATFEDDGMMVQECYCKAVKGERIPAIGSVSLSTLSHVYDGNAKTPKVVAMDKENKILTENVDYAVEGADSGKSVGKHRVNVIFQGNYQGSKTLIFKIVPKASAIKSVTVGKNKITVKATTAPKEKGATKYQIGYKVKGASKWNYTTTTASYKTIKKLKSGKVYIVKLRAYKTVDGIKYYGKWSKEKTTKKVK